MTEQIFMETARAWQMFQKAGILAWPILACSLIALAVIVERWWTYRRAFRPGNGWIAEVKTQASAGRLEDAISRLSGVSTPAARVLGPMLEKARCLKSFSRTTMEKTANHYGSQEVRELERYLPSLETIGNVAPLLGLMGTVMGMVRAFMRIEEMGGKVDASVLAGGIWEALLTTLFGLAVAIPSVIAHNYLAAKVNVMAGQLQDLAVDLADSIEEGFTGHLELPENLGAFQDRGKQATRGGP